MDEFVYDELAAAERSHWWFQGRRRILVDVLRRRLPHAAADRFVVDVGCGTGEMLDMVREFGRVTGLDASPIAVGYCQARFGDAVDVRLGRIPDDVPDGPALLTAFDVVEHLEDDEKALRRICERLAPGGLFVCTVPAFPFLWSGHDEVHHHYRRYTRRQLRLRLEDAGFVVERLTFFNTFLFPAAAAVRLLHRFRPGGPTASDASMASGPANGLLKAVFSAERFLLRVTDLPFGVSLLAVCHRPPASR